ncbi:Hypothetical protein FKW44_002713 [Caligus rogercresseyi]|uniref:Uncharacterized protein n=1 Tax=Caligus rogercresseyi TaxID=217165 RepID=A0A7T8QWI0_CALRO|nr:Hypothetical protein FKW44_002713 [Caligus rogercresseyi]
MTRGSSASTNLYVLELHSKTESSGSSPGFWEGPTDVMGGTIGTFIKNRAHVTQWVGGPGPLRPAHPAGPVPDPSSQVCLLLSRN